MKGVDVKPGTVRQARSEAGLSLAEVAAGELTRAAIHLIETGRSRPSMPTLQLIASRTAKPLAYFLAERPGTLAAQQPAIFDPRLTELERLFVTEDYEGVLQLGLPLLELALDPASEAQVRNLVGTSLHRLERPEEGLPHTRRAKELFTQLGDRYGYVEALDSEAGALYLLEDPSAIDLGEEALRLCRQLEPMPVSLLVRILGHLGNLCVLRKEWSKAIRFFDQAVEVAGPLQDLDRMYTGMSLAYQETGNLGKAAHCAQRALALHTMERDRRQLARAENNLGLVLMKQGDFGGGEKHLETALEHCEATGFERLRAHVLLSLGELELGRGNLEQAEPHFRAAAELAERLGERLTLALSHQFLGLLAAQRGDDEEADAEFWSAIDLLSHESAAERLIECHAAYAQVLEDRGDTRTANQHWKEALAASRPGLVRPVSLDSDLVARAN